MFPAALLATDENDTAHSSNGGLGPPDPVGAGGVITHPRKIACTPMPGRILLVQSSRRRFGLWIIQHTEAMLGSYDERHYRDPSLLERHIVALWFRVMIENQVARNEACVTRTTQAPVPHKSLLYIVPLK